LFQTIIYSTQTRLTNPFNENSNNLLPKSSLQLDPFTRVETLFPGIAYSCSYRLLESPILNPFISYHILQHSCIPYKHLKNCCRLEHLMSSTQPNFNWNLLTKVLPSFDSSQMNTIPLFTTLNNLIKLRLLFYKGNYTNLINCSYQPSIHPKTHSITHECIKYQHTGNGKSSFHEKFCTYNQ